MRLPAVTRSGGLLTVVLAAAMAVVVVAGAIATRGRAHAAPARCEVADLSARRAAGTLYLLTNVSRRPCRLDGYPRLSFLAPSGTVLRDGLRRAAEPRPVVLGRGEAAVFRLRGPGETGPTCASATHVAITPPGATRHLLVRSRVAVCPGQPLVVSALAPRGS